MPSPSARRSIPGSSRSPLRWQPSWSYSTRPSPMLPYHTSPEALRSATTHLRAEHGRGIHLMKLAMDEITYERGGTEVQMRKNLGLERRTCVSGLRSETPCDNPHCRQ